MKKARMHDETFRPPFPRAPHNGLVSEDYVRPHTAV
jgi:hypothetical protein